MRITTILRDFIIKLAMKVRLEVPMTFGPGMGPVLDWGWDELN